MNNITKIGAGLILFYASVYATRAVKMKLDYFGALNYGAAFPFMGTLLLNQVDTMARVMGLLGYTFKVSRAFSRVAENGSGFNSQHNVIRWGKSNAVDLHVYLNGKALTAGQLSFFYHELKRLKLFSGIGVYPFWNTRGVHVDVRADKSASSPATWGDIGRNGKHEYVGAEFALGAG